MRTGIRYLVALVVVLLATPTAARAVTIVNDQGRPLGYWQRVADFSAVQWPDVPVTLRFGRCPGDVTRGRPSAQGCTLDWSDGRLEIYLYRRGLSRAEQGQVLRHELGHVMIQRAWTPADIRVFLLLWGRPRIQWREPAPDPDALFVVESQDQSAYGEEWAADAIGACAGYATDASDPAAIRRNMSGRDWQRVLSIIPTRRWRPEVVKDRMVNTCLHAADTVADG